MSKPSKQPPKNDPRGMGSVPPKSGTTATVGANPPPASPGASVPPVNGAGGPGMAGVSEAQRVVEEARRGRGRPPGSGSAPKVDKGQAAIDAELQQIAADLYSAENFEDLVMLPGDIGFAMTGHEHWLPTERAKRVLARTSAAAARLSRADPRYLAWMLFASALLGHYGGAALKSIYIKRKEKLAAQQDQPTDTQPQE